MQDQADSNVALPGVLKKYVRSGNAQPQESKIMLEKQRCEYPAATRVKK